MHGPVVPKAGVFNINVIHISSDDIYIYAVAANIPSLVSTKWNVTLLSSRPNCSYTVNGVKAASYQLIFKFVDMVRLLFLYLLYTFA